MTFERILISQFIALWPKQYTSCPNVPSHHALFPRPTSTSGDVSEVYHSTHVVTLFIAYVWNDRKGRLISVWVAYQQREPRSSFVFHV